MGSRSGRPRSVTVANVETAGAILRATRRQGFPPTFRELGHILGTTFHATSDRVTAAYAKGLLRVTRGVARAVTARSCRCNAPVVFLAVGRSHVNPGERAHVSRDAVCTRCRGIVLLDEPQIGVP